MTGRRSTDPVIARRVPGLRRGRRIACSIPGPSPSRAGAKLDPGPEAAIDPIQEHTARLARHRGRADELGRRDRTLSGLRLGVAVTGLVMAWLVFASRVLPFWSLGVPVAVFVLLVLVHERVAGARDTALRATEHHADALARLEDRWSGRGPDGACFLDEGHPYAVDLDLFGPGSLFQLLCTARTRTGEQTLGRWLLEPAAPAEIRARQQAVEELCPRLDLREDLALVGERVRVGLEDVVLAAWGTAPAAVPPDRLLLYRRLAFSCSLLPIAGLGAALAALLPASGAIALALLNLLLSALLEPWVSRTTGAGERPARELALLARLLERLEAEPFSAPRLRQLKAELGAAGAAAPGGPDLASRRIARLSRLGELFDWRRNQMFAPLALALLWGPQAALAIEAWRLRNGPRLGVWLAATGEAESFLALAAYAFEHPGDPFPEIVEGQPRFEARGLGHPLLPRRTVVRNDVSLGATRLLVVSGSNMSGKSTLLRTLGVSAVLAQAGAPVRATSLRLSPLAVGASIRLHDSLQEGTSRFYAEVRRVAQLLAVARGPRPLLFLLDEIFGGTNSHDRRVGAEAVARALLERGALGLVTTHDLALAQVAESLAPRAANVHFADRLEDGRIHFDFRMRPGVVTRSNALALMRSVGIEV